MAFKFSRKLNGWARSKKRAQESLQQASAGPASGELGQQPVKVQPPVTNEGTPSPAVIPASEADPASPRASPQERVWTRAYDEVKSNDSKTVEMYEKILSDCLKSTGLDDMEENSGPSHSQMRRLCFDELERMKKRAKTMDHIEVSLKVIDSLSETVSKALKAAPQAAAACLVVCLSARLITKPFAEAKINRRGLVYVLSRMNWYWNLAHFLLGETTSIPNLTELRNDLEDNIVQLCQKLLLFQIKSVCYYNRNQLVALGRDLLSWDNWDDQLNEIHDAEQIVEKNVDQHGSQQIKACLDQLALTATSQQRELENIQQAVQKHSQLGETRHQDDKDEQCQRALYVTNPILDKQRIQDTKGGLFKDSYRWILTHADFIRFRNNPQDRLLWIKGDPGKGKTMLLCGIINELEEVMPTPIIYFFCQATENRLNNAVCVLRGLIYHLIRKQPGLIQYVRPDYSVTGQALFQDSNAWVYLVKIMRIMLQDPDLQDSIIVVDALDECETGRNELVDLIVQLTTTPTSNIKWIISSRNLPDIERQLTDAQDVRLHLEPNDELVSMAVEKYIAYKVNDLAAKKTFDAETRRLVHHYLVENATGTFLWVSLVCHQLAAPELARRHTLKMLREFPPGLDSLYARMLKQISQSLDAHLCKEILAICLTAFRPLSLNELDSLMDSTEKLQPGDLEVIIASCGSFLTLRQGIVYFVHQSAKDYLLQTPSSQILPAGGIAEQHCVLLRRSLKAMSCTLRRDIYDLSHPGFSIDQVMVPKPDPTASVVYSCVFWIDHFVESRRETTPDSEFLQQDSIRGFIQAKFLHWLESLSLMRAMSEGVRAVRKLENHVMNRSFAQDLRDLIRDARRFVLAHRVAIEVAPLQVYASALIFSPLSSVTRSLFESDEPSWLTLKPHMGQNWGACLETLGGHGDYVNCVAFSPNGRWIASGSWDRTVKLWDASTGTCYETYRGHRDSVQSVAFSPDSRLVASGSRDSSARVWNIATGRCLREYRNRIPRTHDCKLSLVFSPNGQRLAAGSSRNVIFLWNADAAPGGWERVLWGHASRVTSLAFTPDGICLFSGSFDGTIKRWNIEEGICLQTIQANPGGAVRTLALSVGGQWLAWNASSGAILMWDVTRDACIYKLEGHEQAVTNMAFSSDDSQLASASADGTTRIWDTTTGVCVQTIQGFVDSIVSFPDGWRLASARDEKVKIWDVTAEATDYPAECHKDRVSVLTSSPDGCWLASGSWDHTVKLWAAGTGSCVQTFQGHDGGIRDLLFSQDSSQVASACHSNVTKIWDVDSGVCMHTLTGPGKSITLLTFSPNAQFLAMGYGDPPTRISIWNTATGSRLQILKVEWIHVMHKPFLSPRARAVASITKYSYLIHPLSRDYEKFGDFKGLILFSPDSECLAVLTCHNRIEIWDTTTNKCIGAHFLRQCRYLSFGQADNGRWRLGVDSCQETNGGPLYSMAQDDLDVSNMSSGEAWITKRGHNILHIQEEFQSCLALVRGKMVVLGCENGCVLMMKFL